MQNFSLMKNALIISGTHIHYFPVTVNVSLLMRASFPVSDWSVILVPRFNVAYSLNAENLLKIWILNLIFYGFLTYLLLQDGKYR